MPPVTIKVLGSGTSVGVPTIGCECRTCTSTDPRDNRLRPSILIQFDGHNVVIDTTPDFRQQALRARIPRIDALLFTHSHADHIMGLDDVRPFNFRQGGHIPIYGSAATMGNIQKTFRYIFENKSPEGAIPKLDVNVVDRDVFEVFGLNFMPILLRHGRGEVHGFRFGGAAYLTDHSEIPDESLMQLQGLDVLFLDALRHKPHPTHSTVERSLEHVKQLAPRRAFFTHISHDLHHARTESQLPPHVRLAYDGLELTV
ncbi:MAG TPA: MBL fold metallo-hydrolase [Bryobacteraceae bacterium]|nr:MBL fold metallo-hydrolase [Bryobacteraceae bacterium]